MQLVVFVAFAAGALQGTSGFGFTLVMGPVCAVLLPGHAAIGTVVRAALTVDLTLAHLDGRGVDRRLLAAYTMPAVAAVPIALVVASLATPASMKLAAGAVTIAAAAMLGSRRARSKERRDDHRGAGVAGFASGLLGATTGLSGPPLAVHVTRSQLPPAATRGTLAWLFVAVDGLAVLVNPVAIGLVPMGAVASAAVAGTLVGRRCDRVLGDRARRELSVGLIAVAGLITVLGAWS